MSTVTSDRRERAAAQDEPVATHLGPLVHALLGSDPPVHIRFWDGSVIAGSGRAAGVLHVKTTDAIRRIMWSPNELGVARAYVAGDLDVEGDLYGLLEALRDATPADLRFGVAAAPAAARAARKLGLIGAPPAPPPEEARLKGWRHTRRRDADAIGHHYDVGNDFYRLVLGPSMTYSCARFTDPDMGLAEAQSAKHELICRKLGLADRPGARLLDVGCGWGSMAIHAASHHDVSVVGITISEAQAVSARQRVADAGLADRVEIRLQDYRQIVGEQFDAISSIGMSEHVGERQLARYFEILHAALAPQGRLLNHAISSTGGSKLGRTSFIGRYVFPDGELIDVGETVLAMEQAGFEVRDVESLREHYAETLKAWVANLEAHWDEAVRTVGAARARVWRLYMGGSVVGFTDGGVALHQVLGVVPTSAGSSGMPRTSRDWEDRPA